MKDSLSSALTLILICALLMISSFAVLPVSSVQPPVDTNTYYVGTIGQPRRVDPARAYDTASGELIMNVYETLIRFSDKPLAKAATYADNVSNVPLADLSQFAGCLAYDNYTVSPDGLNWTFWIKETENIKWHPWTDKNEVTHSDDVLTAADVEYTFERMLVQDCSGAPSWMLCLPLLGQLYLDVYDTDPYTNTIEPEANEEYVGNLINNAITRDGNSITFHLNSPFPRTAFRQILAQTWSSIIHKEFCIDHGCWNASWAPGWSHYRRYPSSTYTPLDRWVSESGRPETAPDVPAMCGTGPYKFTYWNKAILEWRIDEFADYWGGWAEKHLDTIITKGVSEWPNRKYAFLDGSFDQIVVPKAFMWELLDPADPFGYTPLPGIRLYYGYPQLSLDVAAFVFEVDPSTVTTFPDSVPPDFFRNVHVRQAFCHSLNFTVYLRDVWGDEGIQPTSWWIEGLAPDYKNKTFVGHNLDYDIMEVEFKAALFNGTSVWESGFTLTLYYNKENDQRRIICEMMRDAVQSLNSRRTDKPPFKVNVVCLEWQFYLDYLELRFMPMFFAGWLADFADADNFVRPFMDSAYTEYTQRYKDPYVDYLIDKAFRLPDDDERNQTYQELQYIYWRDVPSLPLVQPTGRRWMRDWVKGWYYNQLYPGNLYIDLYKEAPTTSYGVDVSVATIDICSTNTTGHLINQSSQSSRDGITVPLVQVNAAVQRSYACPPAVRCCVVCFGESTKEHVHEFG